MSTFLNPLFISLYFLPGYTVSERQVKCQRHFIHIYDLVRSDGIFLYLFLCEFAEVYLFLVVRRELLTHSRPRPELKLVDCNL